MTTANAAVRGTTGSRHGNAYNLSILVLTVFSLAIMVLRVLPLNEETSLLLAGYDNMICLIFLGDFAWNLATAPVRRDYFIRERGWLDLLGSIPTLGLLDITALLRLARISRFLRIFRLLQGTNRKAMVRDVLEHRAEYAGLITLLLAAVVLSTASLIIVSVESNAAEGNIESGWDAFWWSFVTMTTVGYGDHFPVTVVGRITAMFVMAMGIGIIGALASILASVLVGGDEEQAESPQPDALIAQIEALRAEVLSMRTALERLTPASLASDLESEAQDP